MYKNKSFSFLAIDLGATSGRAILGTIKNDVLKINEINRFPNPIIDINGYLYWDLFYLYQQILKSLVEIKQQKIDIHSLGIDTWGLISYASGVTANLYACPTVTEIPTHLVLPKNSSKNTQRRGIQKDRHPNHEFQLAVSIGYLKRKKQFHLSRHRQNSFHARCTLLFVDRENGYRIHHCFYFTNDESLY